MWLEIEQPTRKDANKEMILQNFAPLRLCCL
jgi:hypothetical protein